MLLVAVVLLGAVVLGLLLGGRLGRLGALPLRRVGLVPAALLAQLAGALVGGAAYAAGLGLSALLVAVFLAHNRRLPGTGLVMLGLAANALVVGVNGAMPVSTAAAARVGVDLAPVAAGADPRHVLAGRGTSLPLLGDVVPVALPLHPEVVSPGDVLVAAGLGELVLLGMRGRRRRAAVAGWLLPEQGDSHGQEGPQAPRPQEVRRQPRASPQRLTRRHQRH